MNKPDDRVVLLDNDGQRHLFRKEARLNADGGVTILVGQRPTLEDDNSKKVVFTDEEMAKLYIWWTEQLRYRRSKG